MNEKELQLTREQEIEKALAQIRSYALREHLNGPEISQLFDVGIVAKGVLNLSVKQVTDVVAA